MTTRIDWIKHATQRTLVAVLSLVGANLFLSNSALGQIVQAVHGQHGLFQPTDGTHRHFTVTAVKNANGEVVGQYENKVFGTQGRSLLHAEVKCLEVIGNAGYFAMVVTQSNNIIPEGFILAVKVVDNGQGAKADPDQAFGGFPVSLLLGYHILYPVTVEETCERFDEIIAGLDARPLTPAETGNLIVMSR